MIQFLRHTLKTSVPPEELQAVAVSARPHSLNEHAYFPFSDSVYFVREGVLRWYSIEKGEEGNEEFTNWFFARGDAAFSYSALTYGQQPEGFLQVCCSSELAEIKKEDYLRLRGQYPWFDQLTRTLELDFFLRRKAHWRQMAHLAGFARYKIFIETYPYIAARVMGKHLAGLIGINPDTLAKLRKRDRDNGRKPIIAGPQ